MAVRGQFAFHDVQVGAANAASPHAQQHMAGGRVRPRNLFDAQRTAFQGRRLMKNGGFHATIVAYWRQAGGLARGTFYAA